MSTSSFADSFDALSGNSPPPVAASEPVDPFDEVDGISGGHDSQRVDTFSNFTDNSQAQPTGNGNGSFFHGDDGLLVSEEATDMPIRGGSGGFVNGLASDDVFAASDGPVLPPPSDMQEEGAALREWKKQNAILLEEKEKREKELLSQIIEEANEYKVSVYEKRKVTCEKNKISNREKEKGFMADQEKFHKESSKQYWKAIAELIPNEVPAMQKRRGKKDLEKKPSIVVVQGPKPGKPADLSRLRQILVKLKHSAPDHLRLSPAPAESAAEDAEASNGSTAPADTAPVAVNPEAVVAA